MEKTKNGQQIDKNSPGLKFGREVKTSGAGLMQWLAEHADKVLRAVLSIGEVPELLRAPKCALVRAGGKQLEGGEIVVEIRQFLVTFDRRVHRSIVGGARTVIVRLSALRRGFSIGHSPA